MGKLQYHYGDPLSPLMKVAWRLSPPPLRRELKGNPCRGNYASAEYVPINPHLTMSLLKDAECDSRCRWYSNYVSLVLFNKI